MSQQVASYKTSGLKKILYFIGIFFFLLILLTALSITLSIRLSVFPISFGGAFVSILTSFPKITVDKDKVYYRVMLNKFNCPFNQGEFKIVEKTGIQALLVAFSTRIVGIEYTPNNSKKKIAFGWMLKESDVREIYAYIQTQQSTQIDQVEKVQ